MDYVSVWEGDPLIYCGRIDAILDYAGGRYVTDVVIYIIQTTPKPGDRDSELSP
jgi:hypothetical protein